MHIKINIYTILFFVFSNTVISQINNDSIVREIILLTNDLRINNNLQSLDTNYKLQNASKHHSKYMSTIKKLSHTNNSQKNYKTPALRAKMFGFEYKKIAENVAYYETSNPNFDAKFIAKKFFEMWKNSPNHLKNMKLTGIDKIGVWLEVIKVKDRYFFYGTQMFGIE